MYGGGRSGRGFGSVDSVSGGRGSAVEQVEGSAIVGSKYVVDDKNIFYSEESRWRRKSCDLCRSDEHSWRDCNVYGDYSELLCVTETEKGVTSGVNNVVSSSEDNSIGECGEKVVVPVRVWTSDVAVSYTHLRAHETP